ncbi:unnamed protein product [Closterium sp. Yama58-4]|nr:unnamed protein product [Closterium sp. Yama58-4]
MGAFPAPSRWCGAWRGRVLSALPLVVGLVALLWEDAILVIATTNTPTLHECDPAILSASAFSPSPATPLSPSRYQRAEGACWSRAELPCYAGARGTPERSPALKRKLHAYHEYLRACSSREPVETVKAKLLAGNATDCRYLFWHMKLGDGQGNQYISFISSFVYALLTNRIFLLYTDMGPGKVMCPPFEGMGERWHLFNGSMKSVDLYLSSVVARKGMQFFPERLDVLVNGTSGINGTTPAPTIANIPIYHNTPNTSLFFCESEQAFLATIPSLILLSNQYFLPALLHVPSFRRHLNDLFPAGRIFQTVSQLIMFPKNSIWAAVTENIRARALPAAARIGLQFRHASELAMRHAVMCITRLQQHPVLVEARARNGGGAGGAGGAGEVAAGDGGVLAGGAGVELGSAGNVGEGRGLMDGVGGLSGEGGTGSSSAGSSDSSTGSSSTGNSSTGNSTEPGSGGVASASGDAAGGTTVILIASLNQYAPFNLSQKLFPNVTSANLSYSKATVTGGVSISSSSSSSNSNSSVSPTPGGENSTETANRALNGAGLPSSDSNSTVLDSNSTALNTSTSSANITNSGTTMTGLVTPLVTTFYPIDPTSSTANITESNVIRNGTLSLDRITTEVSQSGLDAELEHALVDIYSLALGSDIILTSPASTFGYLLSSLFGRPSFFVSASCQQMPLEPCFQHPPHGFKCPSGEIIGDAESYNRSDPNLPFERCPDNINGLSLIVGQ